MQRHKRTDLVNVLLQEALQNMTALEKALAAPGALKDEDRSDTRQQQRASWGNAYRGLTRACSAFQEIEQSKQQRGVIVRGAGG